MNTALVDLRNMQSDALELLFLLHGSRARVLAATAGDVEGAAAELTSQIFALSLESDGLAPIYLGFGGARDFASAAQFLRNAVLEYRAHYGAQ